jgi:hypothetical protein
MSRLRRTVGIGGILVPIFALALFLLANSGDRISGRPWLLLLYVALVLGIAITVASWFVYALAEKTKPGEEIVGPLVQSRLQYCLLLDPFGAGDRIVVSNSWTTRAFLLGWLRPTSTLAQVVAYAMTRDLGLTSYAVVNRSRMTAPPGPVHLRAPGYGAHRAVTELIRRAYLIVMLLAPRLDTWDAAWWEVEQIIEHGLVTRLILVLPPADQDPDAYREARYQLCRILAVLHDPLVFNDVEVDLRGNSEPEWLTEWIEYYDRKFLPGGERDRDRSGRFRKAVQVVYFFRAEGVLRILWQGIDWERRENQSARGHRKPIVAGTYLHGLATAFDTTVPELAKLTFEERYPWPRST